jgi:hypothetical protein
VKIHEGARVFAVSNPSGDLVTFFALDDGAFRGSFDLEGPRGLEVTRDGRAFVVAGSRRGGVRLVDVETLQPRPADASVTAPCLSGSHIYPFDLPG